MLRWYAVYKDRLQVESHSEERAPRATVLKRFHDAAKLGMHNGRAVHGMWLIDPMAPQLAIAIFGRVPAHIQLAYEVHIASAAKNSS